jgi:hypothetical protein
MESRTDYHDHQPYDHHGHALLVCTLLTHHINSKRHMSIYPPPTYCYVHSIYLRAPGWRQSTPRVRKTSSLSITLSRLYCITLYPTYYIPQ